MLKPSDENIDVERRFGAMARLYGDAGAQQLAQAHVAVAGLGGVGSWCAEALARSGVGHLTLIDLDHIAESNINRQVHALTETVGASKVAAMAARIQQINPHCQLTLIDDFVTPDNIHDLFAAATPTWSVLVDCVDDVAAKIAMITAGRRQGVRVLVCGGAGGKTQPLALRQGDLSQATNDALLAKLRNVLRRQHGFPKGGVSGGKRPARVPRMQVPVLWVDEPARLPDAWQTGGQTPAGDLSCAGYGSSVVVTAGMGLAAAGQVMQWLTADAG